MCCLNCQSASDRTTYRISLEFNLNSKWDVWHQCHRSTWLERLLSPSGSELSLCQNAYQPKTVVKAREQLRAANFLSLPRPFLYASVSFFFFSASAALAPLASFFFFLPSLLTSLHPPHHLSRIRWDWVWSFSLLSPRQGIGSGARAVYVRLVAPCQRLVGSSSLLDLPFPPPVALSPHWSGVHLLSVCASAFPTHTRTSHYATSSRRVQTKWNTSCVRQMDFLSLRKKKKHRLQLFRSYYVIWLREGKC